MKKLRLFLSTLGTLSVVFCVSAINAQEWGNVPVFHPMPDIRQVSADSMQNQQTVPPVAHPGIVQTPMIQQQAMPIPTPQINGVAPYVPNYPAPQYAAESNNAYADLAVKYDQLSLDFADMKKELAKKSDKSDPKKGFTSPKIGGRIFMDSVNVMDQNDDSVVANGSGKNYIGFREVRLGATGNAYDFLDYKIELGFENSSQATFKDVFFGIKYVPLLGYVRVGNQYVEDAGSEICNGSTNYTFMEGPAPAGNQFTARRMGISSRHLFANNRGRFFTGVFGAKNVSTNHISSDDNQGFMYNARLTYAPMFRQEGKCMFLYGGYYNFTDPSDANLGSDNNEVSSPGSWSSNNTGLTALHPGAFNAASRHKLGFETVYQNGVFCLQTDFFVKQYSDAEGITVTPTDVTRYNTLSGDRTTYGGFVMGRVFLTPGDFRKYNLENAWWGAPSVRCPFMLFERGRCNILQGPGAWELATYYGFMNNDDFAGVNVANDINVTTPRYGTDHEIGLALNWYWNPQVKWALNYIHQMSDITVNGQGYTPSADIVGMSCRINF